LLAGDANEHQNCHRQRACFNPRPPLLAGDARDAIKAQLGDLPVSIRARHCWRAMRPARLHGSIDYIVSIRARHCWRAMLVLQW